MSADKLVFDLSQEVGGVPNVFIKKDWVSLLDNQNGQYSANQSTLDTSTISNSNKYMSYRESYLAVPMLLTLANTSSATYNNFKPGTAATSADYAIGLKNWFGSVIHSLTVDLNSVTIIQQTPFANMWNAFKLMTSLSWNDVITDGATMGFYPDDPLSWSYQGAVSSTGLGTCNNTNYASTSTQIVVSGAFNKFKSANGNIGFLKRQTFINYDVGGTSGSATFAGQLDTDQVKTLWKSYVSTKQDGSITGTVQPGIIQFSIMATIHLKHLHSFFQQIPLLKGVFMKATLTLNNCTIDFSLASSAITLNSVSNSVGGVVPLMLSSAAANNGAASMGDGTYRANLSVGATCLDPTLKALPGMAEGALARSIYLYVPAYSFNPVFENIYLSSPIKTIEYTDIYQYQISNITAKTGQINNLVTNGLSGLKSVLIIPFYSAQANPIIGAAATNLPVYQSPYDPAGCGATSPLCHFSNFNVVVSGQNMIYNTQNRVGEAWINNLSGVHSVNGNLTDGITSGLIDQQGFENIYCYYYVDVSRQLPVEASVPKSVQVVGQNMSARQVDLFVFCEYSAKISIDALTGSRV